MDRKGKRVKNLWEKLDGLGVLIALFLAFFLIIGLAIVIGEYICPSSGAPIGLA